MKRPRRGFTSVEVIFAIALFALGAAGVMTMQKTAVQANMEARKWDQANAIARMWEERLKRDATQWVVQSPAPAAINFGNASLLSAALGQGWVLPTTLVSGCSGPCDGKSPYFDILGRDLAGNSDANNSIFCTNIRVTQLEPALVRTEVRVYWLSYMGGTVPTTGICTATPPTSFPPNLYHTVTTVTAIHANTGAAR